MAKFTAIRIGGDLRPVDEEGLKAVRRCVPGVEVVCEVHPKRSAQQHRYAMGLFRKVHDSLPEDKEKLFPRMENLRDAILMECGYKETLYGLDGKPYEKPLSVAFDAMEPDEFTQFVDAAKRLITTVIIPGLDNQALEDEVWDMVA